MMRIYNSLTRKVEDIKTIKPKHLGVYTCGPTVYDYVSIGNWRTYVLGDLFVRASKYMGHEIDYVMNITDVGHLTGDNTGDADIGEDRMEKASRREGKTAWDIAKFYTEDFLDGYKKLNMTQPKVFSKATDHIDEQIDLVKKIEERGFAYKTSDGVYFDTRAYEKAGHKYGELSTLKNIKEGVRVKANLEKKNPRDFALWKFSPDGAQRQMEWDSPWGKGFPGWHVECSAMSMKYLGEQFDIHFGGEDLRSTHHPNEIAQSEAATGKKPFVKYWVHGAFLLVDGGRMGKSIGNAYTLDDIEKKGFEPLALRYLYLTAHYRDQLNFTWESLEAAQTALNKLRSYVARFKSEGGDSDSNVDQYKQKFKDAIENDLNMPQALAVVWEVVKSNIANSDKLDLILDFDQVLGLKLSETRDSVDESLNVSGDVTNMIKEREVARDKGDFEKADDLRKKISEMGYDLVDTNSGTEIKPK